MTKGSGVHAGVGQTQEQCPGDHTEASVSSVRSGMKAPSPGKPQRWEESLQLLLMTTWLAQFVESVIHTRRGSLWDERSAEWHDEAGDRDSLGKGDEPSECHREKPIKTNLGRRLACATLPSPPTACGQDLSAPGGGVTTVLGAPGTPVPSKPSL